MSRPRRTWKPSVQHLLNLADSPPPESDGHDGSEASSASSEEKDLVIDEEMDDDDARGGCPICHADVAPKALYRHLKKHRPEHNMLQYIPLPPRVSLFEEMRQKMFFHVQRSLARGRASKQRGAFEFSCQLQDARAWLCSVSNKDIDWAIHDCRFESDVSLDFLDDLMGNTTWRSRIFPNQDIQSISGSVHIKVYTKHSGAAKLSFFTASFPIDMHISPDAIDPSEAAAVEALLDGTNVEELFK
jgi:hypothetical protein